MKLYNSIDFLPIYNYFKCLFGDLRYLHKENIEESKITEELIDLWKNIEEEFEKRMDDKQVKEMCWKIYRTLNLKKKCALINNCLVLLAVKDDEDIIKIVRSLGFRYEIEEKLQCLNVLQGEERNLKNKIEEIESELKEKTDINIDVFELISIIEKSNGFSIDPHKLTTAHFIAYIKDLKKCQKK